MHYNILDTIETDNRVFKCVIDYVSRRQVIIYDLTNSNDPLFRLIAIKWKAYHYDKRFSVFMSIYFPHVSLPDPIVLSLNSIKYSTIDLECTKPKRLRTIRTLPTDET